ncbi:MAG: M48 family metallopeptidase [Flavobacteriales bacterium]|nr:M48 family metallopeptidase [Flavobacteriales bacterium]
MSKIKITLTALLSVFLLETCTRVPITGRRQTNLLPETELMAMALTNYNQVLSESKIISTGANATSVKNAGERISSAVTKYMNSHGYSKRIANYQWQFNLIDDPTVNAWCMPGGKVAFYTGILPICADENGVAVVMGHEIAHAIARHGNERMSQGLLLEMGGVALDVATMTKPDQTRQLFQLAYGVGANLGVMLPFSRKHESEADRMGLIFMAMAGYDPHEAPKFWERMSALGGSRPPQILSTHPDPEKRVEAMNKNMAEAMKYYKPAGS